MKRQKLPTNREGQTHKIHCGPVTLYLTANVDKKGRIKELFVKAGEGWQGWADALCVTASIALQYGAPLDVILRKWRNMRFPPDGIGALSIPDVIARRLLPTEGSHDPA